MASTTRTASGRTRSSLTGQGSERSRSPTGRSRKQTVFDPNRHRSIASPTDRASTSTESKISQKEGVKGTFKKIFHKGGGLGVPSKWFTVTEADPDEFQWEYTYHYFLSLLACTVSLNDLVKFPERCIKYGGAWFVALHLFFTIVFAFPFFALENLLGQSTGATAMQFVNVICPILGGFGITITFTRMIELVEVSTWLCWTFIYLFASVSPNLPWTRCGHHWTNESCFTKDQMDECGKQAKIFWNNTCNMQVKFCDYYKFKEYNLTHCSNDSKPIRIEDFVQRVSPGYQFMIYVTKSPILFQDISDAYILTTFTMCWLFYYMCIRNGMKSTIHVTHFTVVYTFLALLILLATILLSEGGTNGISHHMFQHISALAEGKAWIEALRSALDTFSLGFAINFMFAKFNDYTYNFMRPLSWVVAIDVCFCVLFSFTVAAFLGMAAKKEEVDVGSMSYVTEGIPLLLDSVPRIFRHLPSPHLFCCIFYLFCISISVEIGFVLLETILVSVISIKTKIRDYKQWARMVLCFSQWCIGVFFLTEPGQKVINSVKRCNALDSDFLFAIEAILITWVYGFGSPVRQKHFRDMKEMFGFLPKYHYYLKVGFYITAPVCSLIYTVTRFSNFDPPHETEWWSWLLYVFLLIRSPFILLMYAIYKIVEYRRKNKNLMFLFVCEDDWVKEE